MSITVLLATYNRCHLLAACLAQLSRQAYRPGDEVVILDNGSTDATAAIVAAAADRLPVPVRYVVEPAPGKSRALATGLAASHGEFLALTDDDVIVGDDWVAVVHSLSEEEHLGVAGGRVLPRWSRPAPRWLRAGSAQGFGPLAAPLALLDYGPARAPLGSRTAIGANMVVRRRALDAAGGFPRDLGKLRGTLLSGEDQQVCDRIQACGYAAVYDPRLAVEHHVPADRLRLRYHLRWFFWSGITNAALDRAASRRPGGPRPAVRHFVVRAIKAAARALASAMVVRVTAAVEAVADVAFSLGYLACSFGWIRTGAGPAPRGARRLETA